MQEGQVYAITFRKEVKETEGFHTQWTMKTDKTTQKAD